jgi:hypothetical protein
MLKEGTEQIIGSIELLQMRMTQAGIIKPIEVPPSEEAGIAA